MKLSAFVGIAAVIGGSFLIPNPSLAGNSCEGLSSEAEKACWRDFFWADLSDSERADLNDVENNASSTPIHISLSATAINNIRTASMSELIDAALQSPVLADLCAKAKQMNAQGNSYFKQMKTNPHLPRDVSQKLDSAKKQAMFQVCPNVY
jgi:hypothetical protein